MNIYDSEIIGLLGDIINVKCSESEKWDTYNYYNKPVPRVSNILHDMIHEDYLLDWANGLGFRRQKHDVIRDLSAKKGTASHNLIEEFLETKIIKTDFSDIDNDIRFAVNNVYQGFISWYNMMKENCEIFEIIAIEKVLVCPYFGGTLDIQANINGKIFIIDLKTSNHMTYKYFMQLGAYTYMLQYHYDTPVNGIMILWLDKKKPRYNDYVLDASIPEHNAMISQSIETFLSLAYAYHNKNLLIDQYNNIFKGGLV